jgi:hypothetical protein
MATTSAPKTLTNRFLVRVAAEKKQKQTLIATVIDECPLDCGKNVPGVCGCGVVDSKSDYDIDGVLDCCDDCPNDIDKTVPGLCGCGELDMNSGSDEVPDCEDECPPRPCKDSDRQMWLWRSRDIFRRRRGP